MNGKGSKPLPTNGDKYRKMISTLLYAPIEPASQIEHSLQAIMRFYGSYKVMVYSKENPGNLVEWHPATPMDWEHQQLHQACDLLQFLPDGCTHLLHCECDGFPINPHLWDDRWLQFDYIGAPWGVRGCVTVSSDSRYRVGNGGFSLRSRKFLERMSSLRGTYQLGDASDVWMCQRPKQIAGLRIAPIKEAILFSFEAPIPEFPQWEAAASFGFHGRNLHPHLCC